MSDNNNFDDDTTEEFNYDYDSTEDVDVEVGEPVIIGDDPSALDVIESVKGITFQGTSDVVDGQVTVFHLDDEGNEHSQVIDLTNPELSREEATVLTQTIRTQTNVLYLLIARAHSGKAHLALGYTSFEAYIKAEFNYSKSYAYKLLDQARIIEAIEDVMPEGAQVYVSDATARGLKASMGEFLPELEEKVRDLPTDEAAAVMEDLVQDYRERKEEQQNQGDDEDEDGEEFSGGGNGEYSGDYDVEDYEDEDAFGGEDSATVRRRYEAVYNLYSALAQFTQMPSNEDIIKTIPAERQAQVTAYLDTSVTWLTNFREDWYKEVVNAEDAEDSEGGEDEESDEDNDFSADESEETTE